MTELLYFSFVKLREQLKTEMQYHGQLYRYSRNTTSLILWTHRISLISLLNPMGSDDVEVFAICKGLLFWLSANFYYFWLTLAGSSSHLMSIVYLYVSKLGTKHPWVKDIQVCLGPHLFFACTRFCPVKIHSNKIMHFLCYYIYW